MTPVLEAQGLSVGYRISGGLLARSRVLPILHDINLRLEAGQTLGIVGESGCGKSTLGRALLHLIPRDGGQVLWNGDDPASLTRDTLRRRRAEMQIIFQDPIAALDPRMTLGQIVSRPLATFEPGLSRADRTARVAEALRLVGLSEDFARRYPHELSGGQAQRVGIARALIGKPKVIICDEPVSALDVSIQAQVVNLLMDIQAELGLALVFISHNLAVVRQISHRIMVMCLGRVVEEAPRDAFYARPLHPYAQALKAAVPEPDPVEERLRRGQSLQGELPSIARPPPGCVFVSRCPLVQPLCHAERPVLRALPGGRSAACHFIEE
ncbi:MAG: ATP-binding cassette domain-containing protein [Rhodobacteraceae bacterium]|nr:ATP-binding cassette domain-containing protein [Paracoccaceae bacterium]